MANVTRKFAEQVGNLVHDKQTKRLANMVGQYVVRGGVNFLVVRVDKKKGIVFVSDAKTPLKQITKMKIKSFLSRAVELAET